MVIHGRLGLRVLLLAAVVWLVSANVVGAATLKLAWDPSVSSNAAGYVIYWGTQSGNYPYLLQVGNVTTGTVAGLTSSTRYYFVVRAYTSAGILGLPSAEVTAMTAAPPPLSVTGGSDFNVDGQTDLLWQNDSTGQVTAFFMGGASGNVMQTSATLWPSQAGMTVVATGDFNGDGKPDLVWQNNTTRQVTVTYMGGALGNTMIGWSYLWPTNLPGWHVAAARDFNGDGKPDLVWQNDSTREVNVTYMGGAQGNTFLGWSALWGPQAGWTVVAANDFNSDGKPDLVWQNDTNRQVTVTYFGGAQGNVYLGWKTLWGTDLPGWTVVGALDFNADSKPDLVWMNDSTRQVTVIYMGGAQGDVNMGWNWLSSAGIPGWKAIAR